MQQTLGPEPHFPAGVLLRPLHWASVEQNPVYPLEPSQITCLNTVVVGRRNGKPITFVNFRRINPISHRYSNWSWYENSSSFKVNRKFPGPYEESVLVGTYFSMIEYLPRWLIHGLLLHHWKTELSETPREEKQTSQLKKRWGNWLSTLFSTGLNKTSPLVTSTGSFPLLTRPEQRLSLSNKRQTK